MKIAFFQLDPDQRTYIEKHEKLTKLNPELLFYDALLRSDSVPSETGIDAISIFIGSEVNVSVLKKLPDLKLIAARSTGYDHIDVNACKRRGITVSSVPSYGERTVAEYTFALILMLSRKMYDAYHRIREKGQFNLQELQGFDLYGKTLGVVGTGSIGKHVIHIAKGFGMKVVACDVYPNETMSKELEFRYCSLKELLGKSDIVTLHVPYLTSTHHLINKENIYQMKRGAYLINTSRGQVVETEALVSALKDEHIAGAGLDVLEEEGALKDDLEFLQSTLKAERLHTVLANHALIDHPRVIVTPHNAFNTKEALQRILDVTVQNIIAFASGKPINVVE